MGKGKEFVSSRHISDEAMADISNDPITKLDVLENMFVSALRRFFKSIREENIHPETLLWETFEGKFEHSHLQAASQVRFKINQVEDYIVPVPVEPSITVVEDESVPLNTVTFVSKSYNDLMKEEMQAAWDKMQKTYQEAAKKMGYGNVFISGDSMVAEVQPIAGESVAANLEKAKQKLLGELKPYAGCQCDACLASKAQFANEPEPEPQTYLELKQKALEQGKIAIPPLDDDIDLV